jgi:hypothetical protein
MAHHMVCAVLRGDEAGAVGGAIIHDQPFDPVDAFQFARQTGEGNGQRVLLVPG